jgi:hypothetical protein
LRIRTYACAMVLAVAILIGCDGGSNSSAPTGGAATAPSPMPAPELPGPATAPTTAPAASAMQINNRIVVFPAAKVKLTQDRSQLVALLYSDDPADAIKDTYKGNSFYLRMMLDVGDEKELSKASWWHKARSSEREDSAFGIYLNGHRVQLQPYEVRANFADDHSGPTGQKMVTIKLQGQFLLWNDADSTGLPQTVVVSAEIPATVEGDDTTP